MTKDVLGSPHLADDDLIATLYCEELASAHLSTCPECRRRLHVLQSHRDQIEADQLLTRDLRRERMAAQRRSIYVRLSAQVPFWSRILALKWVPAGAAVFALAGGLLLFQHEHRPVTQDNAISDVELAQEVSSQSQSYEALPADPLKGLFE